MPIKCSGSTCPLHSFLSAMTTACTDQRRRAVAEYQFSSIPLVEHESHNHAWVFCDSVQDYAMTVAYLAIFANSEIRFALEFPAIFANSFIVAVSANDFCDNPPVSHQALFGYTARGNPAFAILAQLWVSCAVIEASLTPDCPSLGDIVRYVRLSHSNRTLYL